MTVPTDGPFILRPCQRKAEKSLPMEDFHGLPAGSDGLKVVEINLYISTGAIFTLIRFIDRQYPQCTGTVGTDSGEQCSVVGNADSVKPA
jgi:hypothetical protein